MLSKRTEKLLHEFCDHMDKVSPKADGHFDMGTYFCHETEDDHVHVKTGKALKTKDLHTCGTQACAFGYLAASPIGEKLRIRLEPELIDGGWGDKEVRPNFSLRGKYMSPSDIAEEALDLSEEQADFLFGGIDDLESPADWALRCRMFLLVKGDVNHAWLVGGVPLAE